MRFLSLGFFQASQGTKLGPAVNILLPETHIFIFYLNIQGSALDLECETIPKVQKEKKFNENLIKLKENVNFFILNKICF